MIGDILMFLARYLQFIVIVGVIAHAAAKRFLQEERVGPAIVMLWISVVSSALTTFVFLGLAFYGLGLQALLLAVVQGFVLYTQVRALQRVYAVLAEDGEDSDD